MKLYSKGGKYTASEPQPAKHVGRGKGKKTRPVALSQPIEHLQKTAAGDSFAEMARLTEARHRKEAYLRKKRRENLRIYFQAAAIFCTIMVATFLFFEIRKLKAASDFRQLIQIVEEYEKNDTSGLAGENGPIPDVPAETDSPEEQLPGETEPPVKTMLPKYADLYLRNTEFFGWLQIEGTNINYPVMRSFEDNDEYLRTNFDGEYSYSGIPFADIHCSGDSDNIIIYAHNMKDGSMFRQLMKYEKESFWKKHPTILFSDLYGEYAYEVMAVFYDRIYKKTEDVFKFYQFIDAENETDFNNAVSQFREKSLYDTGVEAAYGDRLITLVTCSYHVDNGRFVVVARRKE